jgi:hypothetical protein
MTLDGDEWSVSLSHRLTPEERARGTTWLGNWASLRAGLDAMSRGEALAPARSLSVSTEPSRLSTGHGGPYGCEILRIQHCLDSRLTDGGKVVSPTHRPCSTPQKHCSSASGTHSCYRLSKPQGLVRSECLRKLEIHSPHWFSNPRPHGL